MDDLSFGENSWTGTWTASQTAISSAVGVKVVMPIRNFLVDGSTPARHGNVFSLFLEFY